MYFLKQCPRCNGDLTTDSDQYGDFISCLQCGMCQDVVTDTSGPSAVGLRSTKSPVAALSREGYRINTLRPAPRQLSAAVT